jgi:hypothetical protein
MIQELHCTKNAKHGTAYQAFSKVLKVMYRYGTCGTLVYNCTRKHTHSLPTTQLIVNPDVDFLQNNVELI